MNRWGKIIICAMFFSWLCHSCQSIKKINYTGSYYYIDEMYSQPILKLSVYEDTVEFNWYNQKIACLDSFLGIGYYSLQDNLLDINPLHNNEYEVSYISNKNNDTTFIHCLYSSYNIKDTMTWFQIVCEKDTLNITPVNGVISFIHECDSCYLQVISTDIGISSYTFKPLFYIEKGLEYYLWLSASDEEVSLKGELFLNGNEYFLKYYYANDTLTFPLLKSSSIKNKNSIGYKSNI